MSLDCTTTVNDIFYASINSERYMNIGAWAHKKYQRCYETYIKTGIGTKPASQLNPQILCRLFNSITSHTDLEFIRSIVTDIVQYALDCGLLSGNPLEPLYFESSEHNIKCLRTLTEEELPIFLFHIENEPMRNCFYLSLLGGLRLGECLGLKWRDVNFDDKIITVRNQAITTYSEHISEYVLVNHTKTNNERNIHMIPLLEDALRNEKARQERRIAGSLGRYENPHGLVFTDEFGQAYHATRIQNTIKRISLQMNIPDFSFHGLRRTFATMSISAGADLASVQQMLDHYNAALTLQHYVACTDTMLKNSADKIEKLIMSYST